MQEILSYSIETTPMPKRTRPTLRASAKAEASAKLQAIAKLTYEKKVVEVIPPDVTRLRSNKWWSILSPLTEWAGLKGDKLRYQRIALQIQQEEVLTKLAFEVRERLKGQDNLKPVPLKFMIPLLEGASLEDSNSALISWWASLLVHGTISGNPKPYFVSLMRMVGPEEAQLLEFMWAPERTNTNYFWRDDLVDKVIPVKCIEFLRNPDNGNILNDLQHWAHDNKLSAQIRLNKEEITPFAKRTAFGRAKWAGRFIPLAMQWHDATNVCFALGLVRKITKQKIVNDQKSMFRRFHIDYLDFTNLGFDFMQSTHLARSA
jgi:hypothetical protein